MPRKVWDEITYPVLNLAVKYFHPTFYNMQQQLGVIWDMIEDKVLSTTKCIYQPPVAPFTNMV